MLEGESQVMQFSASQLVELLSHVVKGDEPRLTCSNSLPDEEVVYIWLIIWTSSHVRQRQLESINVWLDLTADNQTVYTTNSFLFYARLFPSGVAMANHLSPSDSFLLHQLLTLHVSVNLQVFLWVSCLALPNSASFHLYVLYPSAVQTQSGLWLYLQTIKHALILQFCNSKGD